MQKVAYQGHRGCRGLLPENTIPAFKKALDYVEILEMDVVVSQDKQIIISHEPWMSHKICSHPDGKPVIKEEAKKLNLYQMSYEQIKSYDCGLRGNPKFSQQQKMKVHKPSLKDMVEAIESYVLEENKKAPWYDIEIKSEEDHYNIMQPEPAEFVRLILNELNELGVKDRSNLQSFDLNILEEIRKQDLKIKIAYLVDNMHSVEKNFQKLSYTPDIYSPYYKLVTEKMVDFCHSKNVEVIPWTVNDPLDMKKLTLKGVDGIITDYPNLKIEH